METRIAQADEARVPTRKIERDHLAAVRAESRRISRSLIAAAALLEASRQEEAVDEVDTTETVESSGA